MQGERIIHVNLLKISTKNYVLFMIYVS